jgi:hypothetical protein
MNDTASLIKAMEGAYAVYAMTDYWNTMDMNGELQQGKNLADAAKVRTNRQSLRSVAPVFKY